MKKLAVACIVLCCMIILGCGGQKNVGVEPDEVQSSQNLSKNEAMCRDVISAYYSQQINFDNSKIRDLNSHIVSANNVLGDLVFSGKKDYSILSNFMLDRTTDRTTLRDSICHKLLMGKVSLDGQYGDSMEFFSRKEGTEIAEEYVKLYSMTKVDVQHGDDIKDKNDIINRFKYFIKNPQPDELYSFKIHVEHIDFKSINDEIVKRIIEAFIKDPKIIFKNERIKNGKTTAPTELYKLFACVDFSKDRPYIMSKMKQIFLEVLTENEKNPKMIHDEFNTIMYGKPLAEGGNKIYLVTNSLAVDEYIWKGNNYIWKGNKRIWDDDGIQPKKEKSYGLNFTVLGAKLIDNDTCQFKLEVFNNTAKEVTFDGSFEVIDEYDNLISEGEGLHTFLDIPNVRLREFMSSKTSKRIYLPKDEYDKFTDEELEMLTGAIPIPSQKKFEITIYVRIKKNSKELLNKSWLRYGNIDRDNYWEINLNKVVK